MRPPLDLPSPPLADPAAGLVLRPWGTSPGDPDSLTAAWDDPDVARWTGVPEPHDRPAAQRWIAGEQARRDAGLVLDLVVADAADPAVVHGEVGLVLVEPGRGWAEVGFWLFPAARGRHRAARALALLADWALGSTQVRRLFARTAADNPAAGRVAEAAGFRLAGEAADGVRVWIRDRPPSEPSGAG